MTIKDDTAQKIKLIAGWVSDIKDIEQPIKVEYVPDNKFRVIVCSSTNPNNFGAHTFEWEDGDALKIDLEQYH